MKFGILVNEGPYTHQAADTAYNFCKSALEAGHEIFRVFFYHDGVNNATRYTLPRGILDENEAKRQGKDGDNLAPGFRISGLGQLIEAGIQSDRMMVFGD